MRTFIASCLAAISLTLVSFRPNTVLVVTSAAFSNNGYIPSKYSCEGIEVSPPLQVSNVPSTTLSIAVILHDPDAPVDGGVTHWVMWNLDKNGYIPENYKKADQGMNTEGRKGYLGMCPPKGTHRYFFRVYALDKRIDLMDKPNIGKEDLEREMQGHILAQGELVGLYKKTK